MPIPAEVDLISSKFISMELKLWQMPGCTCIGKVHSGSVYQHKLS